MKRSAAAILLFFLSLPTTSSHAQQASITGTVENLDGMVAYVSLHAAKDSGLIKDIVSGEQGLFSFDSVQPGDYVISLQHMSHLDYWSAPVRVQKPDETIDLGKLYMEPDKTMLSEVTINSTEPYLERQIDRIVVNPHAMISNAGISALEVLEKTPGVMVGSNGSISMKGKAGVQVFIDDKPTYLSNEELASYLRSLPSGSIEHIELMSNPPAMYEAEGNAGIINIKLEKSPKKGLNIGLSLGYQQGRYAKTQNSLNINYRINKLNFTGNFSFSQSGTYQDLSINRYYFDQVGALNSSFHQQSYIKKIQGGRNARIGVDYYATKRSTIGLVLSGFINPEEGHITNSALVLNQHGETDQIVQSYKPSEERWLNGSANLNYTYKINEHGRELSANADYIDYQSGSTQTLANSNYEANGSLIDRSLLEFDLPASLRILSLKTDYAHPLGNKGKIDGGIKWSRVSTDNDARVYDNVDGHQLVNNEFTNRFAYNEQITSGYINYVFHASRLALQVGLRLENTRSAGDQDGNAVQADSTFDFQYTSIFPTLFALYKFDTLADHQLSLSLGRRISRPNYQDLNPFTFPIDRYTYYMGNPFLRPTFSYGAELAYTYKNRITTSFEYTIVKDLINETNEQRGTIYYSRPGNLGNHTLWGFTLSGNIPIRRWWTLQLYSEAKNAAFNTSLYGQPLNEKKWYWYLGPVNQFTITDKWQAELSGSYQTSILVGQFLTIPVWQARAAMSYTILKGQGTIRLSLSDIFYTNQPGGDIRNIANSKADWLSYLDSRVVGIGFSYRFSKGNTMEARKSGASDPEKERVKL